MVMFARHHVGRWLVFAGAALGGAGFVIVAGCSHPRAMHSADGDTACCPVPAQNGLEAALRTTVLDTIERRLRHSFHGVLLRGDRYTIARARYTADRPAEAARDTQPDAGVALSEAEWLEISQPIEQLAIEARRAEYDNCIFIVLTLGAFQPDAAVKVSELLRESGRSNQVWPEPFCIPWERRQED
jgi:hypothetical protein